MLNFIEKLRQKPDRTKTLIAFSTSLFFAGTIFLVWITVVLPDVKKDQIVRDKIASIEPSPLASFFNNIAQGFSGLKDQFSGITSKISEISANAVSSSKLETVASSTTEATASEDGVQFVEVASTSSPYQATTSKIR